MSVSGGIEPELLYVQTTTSVDVVLDSETPSHSIEWSDGSSVHLDHNDLDLQLVLLLGTNPDLVSDDASSTPGIPNWSFKAAKATTALLLGREQNLSRNKLSFISKPQMAPIAIKAAPIWNGWTMAS